MQEIYIVILYFKTFALRISKKISTFAHKSYIK